MTTIDRTEQMAKDIIQERYGQPLKAAMLLCEALEVELRAARKDAERYRWARQQDADTLLDIYWDIPGHATPEQWDEAIDHCMAAVIDSRHPPEGK